MHVGDITNICRQVTGEAKNIDCPITISDYNRYMGGVDLADQAMCYYSVSRETMKWWRRDFWRMHDQAITNAFSYTRQIELTQASLLDKRIFAWR